MDDEKIIEQIQKFYQSKEYHSIKALRERKTLLDVFKKTRSETIHSSMIAWLFNNTEFCNLPEPSLLFLLRLIANKADQQKPIGNEGFQDLWERIILNQVSKLSKVNNDYAETEIQTKAVAKNNGEDEKGKADIVITCKIDDKDQIRICIENKVDSKEHDDQCKKYYDYFSSLDNSDNFKTIYVFLAPQIPNKELSDGGHYIKITYQNLLDAILYPLAQYKDMFSSQSYFYLIEYINTITSIRTNTILAMGEDYQDLLKKFYKENEDLIFAAIDAAAPEEVKTKAFDLRNSLKDKEYTIKFPDKSESSAKGASELARVIATYLAKKTKKVDLLNKWKKLTLPKGSKIERYFIRPSKTRVIPEEISCKGGDIVYCSNVWCEDKVKDLISRCKKVKIYVNEVK